MRHRKAGKKLNRTSSHRKALMRNMVTSLLEHERIEIKTTWREPSVTRRARFAVTRTALMKVASKHSDEGQEGRRGVGLLVRSTAFGTKPSYAQRRKE